MPNTVRGQSKFDPAGWTCGRPTHVRQALCLNTATGAVPRAVLATFDHVSAIYVWGWTLPIIAGHSTPNVHQRETQARVDTLLLLRKADYCAKLQSRNKYFWS